MYGYVYLTTNKINGMKYIGMHKHNKETIDPNYFGSGRVIARALKKYGKENFSCKILEFCETKQDLILAEQYYISYHNAVEADNFYNLDSGRGNSHVYTCKEDTRKKLSLAQKNHRTIHKGNCQKVISIDNLNYYLQNGWELGMIKKDRSERIKKFKKTHYDPKNKSKIESWKKHLSESIKGRRWLNNGIDEKQVQEKDVELLLEQGYVFGRLYARGKLK